VDGTFEFPNEASDLLKWKECVAQLSDYPLFKKGFASCT